MKTPLNKRRIKNVKNIINAAPSIGKIWYMKALE